MTHLYTFTGFGQPADALHEVAHAIAPTATIEAIDYQSHGTLEETFAATASMPAPDHILGWSLGGVVAAHVMQQHGWKPRQMTLFASPFHYLQSASHPYGVPKPAYAGICDSFAENAEQSLKEFLPLLVLGDAKAPSLLRMLKHNQRACQPHLHYWLNMLGQLHLQQVAFPPTCAVTLIHGENDAIIAPAQSHATLTHAKQGGCKATLALLPDCGHTPHMHIDACVSFFSAP